MLNKGDLIYYTKIFSKRGIYELYELRIRTLTDKYFVGTDERTKQAHLFGLDSVGKCIFTDREEALSLIREFESQHTKEENQEVEE